MGQQRVSLADFDLRSYLDQHYEVKRVASSSYEVHMNCPFCGEDRRRFYIHVDAQLFWCHNCRTKPTLATFISHTEKIPIQVAQERLKDSPTRIVTIDWDKVIASLTPQAERKGYEPPPLQEMAWPDFYLSLDRPTQTIDSRPYLDYLAGRNIGMKEIKEYQIGFCPVGPYKNRVIIPIFMNGQLVGYQARDITGQAEPKVLNPAGFFKAQCLFNYDRAKESDEVYVVEGPFSAMHIGPPAVATFGKVISDQQRRLLEPFNKIVIMLDADASELAVEQAKQLHNLNVWVVLLPEGQPDHYPKEKLLNMIHTKAIRPSGDEAFQFLLKKGIAI